MYSIRDLSVFVQAARSSSFVEAATALGITPSSVGKTIQKIEEKHNIMLFARSTRSISLTEEGQILYRYAENIMQELDAATITLEKMKNNCQGKLKISVPNIDEIFDELIAGFILEHPNIELDISLSDDYVDIIKESYDAVIRFGYISDSRLFAKRIGDITMNVFHSAQYVLQADLYANQFLFYRYPASGKIESWNNVMPLNMDKIGIYRTFNSIPLIKKLCMAGQGLAYLPERVCLHELANGQLIKANDSGQSIREVSIVWPHNKNVSSKLRAFIDYFSTHWQSS